MSTHDEIRAHIDGDRLHHFRPKLKVGEQYERLLYMTPITREWLLGPFRTLQCDGYIDGAATPQQQLSTLVRRFLSGKDFSNPLPHLMKPSSEGVWRLKTADLRIVGWAVSKEIFIISEIDKKANCGPIRDEQLRMNTILTRAKLNIAGGTYYTGEIDGAF